MGPNPYAKYQEQSVMTMTHGEMLVKLYDETVRQIHLAIAAIASKDTSTANQSLLKAQQIVNYLRSTLDFKYEISNQLASFYDFFNEKLRNANIHKTAEDLSDIAALVMDLRDAFAQGEKIARVEQQGAGMQTVRIG